MLFDFSFRYLDMTTVNEANGWYGGTLLGDQDETSDIYRHYAELIQVWTFTNFCSCLDELQYFMNHSWIISVDQ